MVGFISLICLIVIISKTPDVCCSQCLVQAPYNPVSSTCSSPVPGSLSPHSVTWSLNTSDPEPWWVLLSFPELSLVDSIEIRPDIAGQHHVSSVTLQFSDGSSAQIAVPSEGGVWSLPEAVLTNSVVISTNNSFISEDSSAGSSLKYHFHLGNSGSPNTGLHAADISCSYVNTNCSKLTDKDITTWHIVSKDQVLVFSLTSPTPVAVVSFLEAHWEGSSLYQNVQITIEGQMYEYSMCEIPGSRGPTWQHIILPSPVTTDSVKVVFTSPFYKASGVWGLLEAKVYTGDITGISGFAQKQQLCSGGLFPTLHQFQEVIPTTESGNEEESPQNGNTPAPGIGAQTSTRASSEAVAVCECSTLIYMYIIIAILGALCAVLLVTVIFMCWRNRRAPSTAEKTLPMTDSAAYVSPDPVFRKADDADDAEYDMIREDEKDPRYTDSSAMSRAGSKYDYDDSVASSPPSRKPSEYLHPQPQTDLLENDRGVVSPVYHKDGEIMDKPYEFVRQNDQLYTPKQN